VIKETTVRKSPRRGFTLLELLVVIGIILLLVSIVVFGLRHVNAAAARHETIAEMNICEGMLKEYQSINGFTNIETPGTMPSINVPLGPTPADTANVVLPVYVLNAAASIPGPPPSFLSGNDLSASSTGDFGDRGGSKEPRYIAPCLYRTKAVMYVLLRDPKNRVALNGVPAQRILEGPPDSNGNGTQNPVDYAIVLDGWGNPIIYVPRGGLVVWLNLGAGDVSYFLVRSSGTYQCDPNGLGAAVPSVGPNDHPFFASAGQDGIFTDPQAQTDNGTDNIYSFQQ
jgi:prepilin-type N-terminal cleavage/methylation domain-containing protein